MARAAALFVARGFQPSVCPPFPFEVRSLDGLAQDRERAAVLPEPLTRGGCVARPQRVDFADAYRIDPERLGNAIHVHFGGELRLRRAEAAERAVGRRVRHRRAAADADVIAAIRSGRVDDPARQHDGAERRVRAAVDDRVDVDRGQRPVALHASAVADDGRVPLGRRQHVLDAVVHELHRPLRFDRDERGVSGDHRRVLFLAAEAAAGLSLHDADFVVGQIEQHFQRAVDVVRTLHRPVHRHAAVFGHGDDAVRLDIELFLMTCPVFAFDDDVRFAKTLVDPSFVNRDGLERDRRRRRVVGRDRLAIPNPYVSGEQGLAIGVRQQKNRLGDVANQPLRQARLVVVNERDNVPSGDVAVVD